MCYKNNDLSNDKVINSNIIKSKSSVNIKVFKIQSYNLKRSKLRSIVSRRRRNM